MSITQRKVKKGEKLWNIAEEFNIPAAQRTTELWKQWGYTGDPRKLPVGFTLNIPTPEAPPTSKEAEVIPKEEAPDTPAALKGLVDTEERDKDTEMLDELKELVSEDNGYSASFTYLTKAGQQLIDVQKKISEEAELVPLTGTPEQQAMLTRQKEAIKTETARSREEITDIMEAARVERGRALEMISAAPATSRYAVESFITKSDNFDKAIVRSIERLQAEEDKALAEADYEYANKIRQQRMDYYNIQKQVLQENINFMATAYNMLLTGKQFARQEQLDKQTFASNYLENTIPAFAGETIDTLPEEVSNQLLKQGEVLGLDADTLNMMLKGDTEVNIVRDDKTGWVIGIDKNTGETVFKTLMPGRTGVYTPTPSSTEVLSELSSDTLNVINTLAAEGTPITPEDYAALVHMWTMKAPSKLKVFFQNFPTSQYLPDPTTPDLGTDTVWLINQLKAQEEALLSTDIMSSIIGELVRQRVFETSE